MNRLVVGLLLLCGCASQRAALQPAAPCSEPSGIATRPATAAQPGKLCVRLTLAAGVSAPAPATVVLVWYRPEEAARFYKGLYPPFDLLEAFLERARVVPNVALGEQRQLAIDYPGGDAVVLAVADVSRTFWPTMFGGGPGNFIGISAKGGTEVTLAQIPARPPPPESCAGERFELVRLEAPDVAGTIGNDVSRRLCVWLPASYGSEPARRYPVVYLLPGFASSDITYLRGNQDVRTKVDELAKAGGGEAIVVGVDTSTRHGSTYFTDSAAGGQWDAFTLKMTAEIDRRFRTRADARGRAVVGHSTGGFNAVSLALRRPDVFSIIGASAPDGLDFEGWLADGKRVRPLWLAWSRLENAVGGMGQIVSYAAAWGEPFPFDLESGALTTGAWEKWRAHSPMRLLDDAAKVEAAKRVLAGRIFLTVGRRDEFGLHPPTERFGARLTALGIAHEYSVTDNGHATENMQPALLFAIRTLKEPR